MRPVNASSSIELQVHLLSSDEIGQTEVPFARSMSPNMPTRNVILVLQRLFDHVSLIVEDIADRSRCSTASRLVKTTDHVGLLPVSATSIDQVIERPTAQNAGGLIEKSRSRFGRFGLPRPVV
jgi:hypothetical protein